MYLAIFALISIISKVMPRSVQQEITWEVTAVATLKGLQWWQRVQGGLYMVTAACSVYLLSYLGVEDEESELAKKVSTYGSISMGFAALIAAFTCSRLYEKHQKELESKSETELVAMQEDMKSIRTFSTGEIGEGVAFAGLI